MIHHFTCYHLTFSSYLYIYANNNESPVVAKYVCPYNYRFRGNRRERETIQNYQNNKLKATHPGRNDLISTILYYYTSLSPNKLSSSSVSFSSIMFESIIPTQVLLGMGEVTTWRWEWAWSLGSCNSYVDSWHCWELNENNSLKSIIITSSNLFLLFTQICLLLLVVIKLSGVNEMKDCHYKDIKE